MLTSHFKPKDFLAEESNQIFGAKQRPRDAGHLQVALPPPREGKELSNVQSVASMNFVIKDGNVNYFKSID